MDPNPVTLSPEDNIGVAAKCIMQHRYRNVPVVDDDGRYLGIFGVHCLLQLVLPHAAVMEQGLDSLSFVHENVDDLRNRLDEISSEKVRVCIKHEATVTPGTPLMDALLMLYRTKTSIPVVEPGSGRLAGMISYWDVGEHIMNAR